MKKPNNTSIRINQAINAVKVRLIGTDKEQLGVVQTTQALATAEDAGLDLVEVSPNAQPPVCRVMDFGKFLYAQKKHQSDVKKKQKKAQVKIVKYRPGTEEGDYQVKFKNVFKFLTNGDKVKVVIWFRGREMQHSELGLKMLNRIEKDCKEFAVVEQYAKMEGRQLGMMLAPRSKKNKLNPIEKTIEKISEGVNDAEDKNE